MPQSIMIDNQNYLKAWMEYNPALKNELTIEGTNLVYKEEKIDISHFYLPEMLYNENFRKQITEYHDLTCEDLFQIIKLYVETEEMNEKEQRELQMLPKINNIEIRKDQEKEFLVITDSLNKKYRYDTTEPEKIINLYLDLKKKKGEVTLKELGRVIQNEKS